MTTEPEPERRAPWRDLRAVMLATLHVAVAAYAVRTLVRPSQLGPSLAVWMPLTLGVALFLSWPIGRAIAAAFDPDRNREIHRKRCPRCGRAELRPLVRTGRGIFEPIAGYRCAACWSTLRRVEDRLVAEHRSSSIGPVDPSGIEFLGEPTKEGEIRFLDDGEPGTHGITA
jgi:hypothetical protein